MKNKLLNKYLLPYYISSAVFLTMGVCAADLISSKSKLAKIIYADDSSFIRSNTNKFICALLITLSVIMVWLGLVVLPHSSNERANKITRKYLQNVFDKHPELKQYEFILNNPKALQQICAVACNSLDKTEQNKILRIVNNTLNKEPKSDFEEKEIFANMEKAIFDIVNKHIETNPTHMEMLMNIIKNLNKTYVVFGGEKSR